MYVRRLLIISLSVVGVWYVLTLTFLGQRFFDAVRTSFIYVAQIGRETRYRITESRDISGVEVTVLQSTIADLEMENAQLRDLLSFSERFVFNGIGGEVIVRTFDPVAEELVLNRGSQDGVTVGDPVVASDGVLVGVISHVEERRSVTRLLIDPSSRVAGRLLNTDQTEGVVSGGHGIVVRMELIPRDENVTEGMILVSSGLDELIPRGLVIGEVVAVEPDTNSLFLRAIIAPPIEYDRLTHVVIGASL